MSEVEVENVVMSEVEVENVEQQSWNVTMIMQPQDAAVTGTMVEGVNVDDNSIIDLVTLFGD